VGNLLKNKKDNHKIGSLYATILDICLSVFSKKEREKKPAPESGENT